MGSKALNIAIESRFNTLWTATGIHYDNVPSDATVSAWVSMYVLDGDSNKASLGTSPQIRRHTGTVIVDIYTVIDTGSAYGRQLADSAAAIFRDVILTVSDGQIHFLEPRVKNLRTVYYAASGSVTGPTPWQQNVCMIPYFYDQLV